MTSAGPRLLGPADVRSLAERLGIRPTKQRGQNFVIDANTVRRIVRTAGLDPSDVVVEVGPGLGSLTLALLGSVSRVVAIEVDPLLAAALPGTVADFAPGYADRLEVVEADAMRVTELPGPPPTASSYSTNSTNAIEGIGLANRTYKTCARANVTSPPLRNTAAT